MKKTLRAVFTLLMALCLAACLFCASAFAESEPARPEESPVGTNAAPAVGGDGEPVEEIDIPDEKVPVAAVPADKSADVSQQVTGEKDNDALSMAGAFLAIAGLGYVVVTGKKHRKD